MAADRIGVGGPMGAGIAQVAIEAGFEVVGSDMTTELERQLQGGSAIS